MVNGRQWCGGCLGTKSRDRVTPGISKTHVKRCGGRQAKRDMTCDWRDTGHPSGERCGRMAAWHTRRDKRGYCEAHRCPSCDPEHNCIRVDGKRACGACTRRKVDHERRDEDTMDLELTADGDV